MDKELHEILRVANQLSLALSDIRRGENQWIKAEDYKPEDDRNCLVSWWDIECEMYVQPIRAYWLEDQQRFFMIDTDLCIAVEAEIWCYWPELPKERL